MLMVLCLPRCILDQQLSGSHFIPTPLGNDHFRGLVGQIEATLNWSVGYVRRGWPVMVKEKRWYELEWFLFVTDPIPDLRHFGPPFREIS